MKLRTVSKNAIATRGPDGANNGFLVPIYNVHDGFIPEARQPAQVYLTVCTPGTRKGPHLHKRRWGYFTCIRGNIRATVKLGDTYDVAYSGEDHGFSTIEVPAGAPALLENIGSVDAYIINTPSPAWHVDDQDEHPITDWAPPELT